MVPLGAGEGYRRCYAGKLGDMIGVYILLIIYVRSFGK